MKRIHKIAAAFAVVGLLAVGSACSDTTGTEDWWDEQDQAEYLDQYGHSSQASSADKPQTGKPKGSMPPEEKQR